MYNSTGSTVLAKSEYSGLIKEDVSITLSGPNSVYLRIIAKNSCSFTSDYCYDLQFIWEPANVCNPKTKYDLCSNAFTITPSENCNYIDGTTCGSSPSNPTTGLQMCSLSPSSANDVWFKFEAPATSAIINVKSGPDFDAIVNVFSNVLCGSVYNQLSCTNSNGISGIETVSLSGLTIGNTYWIRVYNNTGLTGTDFQICVVSQTTCTAPMNNECTGAFALIPSSSVNYQPFNTNCATQSIAAISPCNGIPNGNADDDVWFKFSATAGQTYVVRLQNESGFDGVLDLRTGGCNGVSVACDDQVGSSGVLNLITYQSTINQTLYARVYHYDSGSGSGNFKISVVSQSTSCTRPDAPILNAPSNFTSTSVYLSWNNVNAASYNVYYGTGSCPWTAGNFYSNTANTFATVTGLSAGLTYKFMIVAKNSETCLSDNSNCQSGITSTSCAITGIIPTLIAPGLASGPGTTLTTTTPTLSWNAVPGATHYGVNIRDLTTNMLVVDENCTTSGLNSTVPAGILSNNGQYRWNIKAVTNCGTTCVSGFASPLYFNISSGCTTPTIPLLTLSNVSSTSAYLSWNNVGAQSYDVYYSSGSCPWTTGTIYGNTTTNFLAISGLSTGTPYKFVVVAKNSSTCFSQNSNCQSATTSNVSYFISTSSSPKLVAQHQGWPICFRLNATISATSNPGYTFVNWTENGIQAAYTSTHTFNVQSSRNLLANFTTCSYTINSNSVSAIAQGGEYSFWVFTSNDCTWNAFTDNCNGMLNITNPTGSGNGFITFNVGANPNSTSRSCTISVGGKVFTVNQVGSIAPCSVPPATPNTLSGYVDGSNILHLTWFGNNSGVTNF
ncbi:MAG: hypothetical protein IPO98_09310 [Saprospiraceae bacterium]|nr:hypothetical protein [Saprospiraceae bacterium]